MLRGDRHPHRGMWPAEITRVVFTFTRRPYSCDVCRCLSVAAKSLENGVPSLRGVTQLPPPQMTGSPRDDRSQFHFRLGGLRSTSRHLPLEYCGSQRPAHLLSSTSSMLHQFLVLHLRQQFRSAQREHQPSARRPRSPHQHLLMVYLSPPPARGDMPTASRVSRCTSGNHACQTCHIRCMRASRFLHRASACSTARVSSKGLVRYAIASWASRQR